MAIFPQPNPPGASETTSAAPVIEAMKAPRLTADIPTQVKDPQLVERRRRQIIDAAVRLFIANGFHKTTTRQIARKADISIGALYEYVASKEDVLYLVCDSIHGEVERMVSRVMAQAGDGRNTLTEILRAYFQVCHRMSDFILLIYQETCALPPQWQERVLANELRITNLFVTVLNRLASSGHLAPAHPRDIELAAHNISVLGHMWVFRRWYFGRNYTIEAYIARQTDFIVRSLASPQPQSRTAGRAPETAP